MAIKFLVLFIVIIINSVSTLAVESTDSIESDYATRNDTIEVVLKNGYVMYWDMAEMNIIAPWDQSKSLSVNKGKRIKRISMYEQMADTTSLGIYVPYKFSGPLRVGDLVMILLMRQLDLPIRQALNHDLHWFNPDSPIPDGLLDELESDRENNVKKLIKYCRNANGFYKE